MNTNTMTKLSEAQMETVCGGNYYSWLCNAHGVTPQGFPFSSSSSSGGPTFIHFGNSSNASTIIIKDVYIGDGSNLILNINQGAF